MVDFLAVPYQWTVSSFFFIIDQILILIFVYNDGSGWKIRFSRIPKYRNLRPIQSKFKISSLMFLVSIIAVPIIGILFSPYLESYIESLQYGILALPSALIGAFFLIWHYATKTKWSLGQAVLIFLEFLLLTALVYLNYFR